MTQDPGRAIIAGAQIEGVAKGGKQDAASSAQINAITATIKQLGWNPDEVITAIDLALGDALDVSAGNPGTIIKDYLRGLSGDDAGKLLDGAQGRRGRRGQADLGPSSRQGGERGWWIIPPAVHAGPHTSQ